MTRHAIIDAVVGTSEDQMQRGMLGGNAHSKFSIEKTMTRGPIPARLRKRSTYRQSSRYRVKDGLLV